MNNLKIMAILETSNFTFYAFAESEKHAIELLEKRWILHQKKTGATYTFSELLDDVFFTKIQAGAYEASELPKSEENEGK